MGSQAPGNVRDVPQVVIAQRVVDKLVRGALLYPEPETGEAMVGLVIPREGHAEPDIYVLDTISPGEHAVREWGMFEQGDDWQGDVFNWMYYNWEAFRELRRPSYGNALAAKWDTPLRHVGDWHKQPGDMTEPTSGDAQTARRMIDDLETAVEHIVAPIVTMYPLAPVPLFAGKITSAGERAEASAAETPPDGATGPEQKPSPPAPDEVAPSAEQPDVPASAPMPESGPNAIVKTLEDEGWHIRIDFWYMSRRLRQFAPVTPVVWPDDRLPSVPPVAWHLAHPRRFDQEFDLLTEAGYAIDVVRWDADGKPPYEICFSVYKPGGTHVFLLVTSVDYPVSQPAVRVAPLVNVADDEDVFEKLYEASEPVGTLHMPEWTWDSKRTLFELVRDVEGRFKGKRVP